MQRAEATLAASGHKRGGARRAVVELLDAQQCALTAVEIEDALREGGGGAGERRRVSRASVYRILDELERLGLVQRVETGQAMVRYERVCEHEEHITTISCATSAACDALLRHCPGERDRDAQRAGPPEGVRARDRAARLVF